MAPWTTFSRTSAITITVVLSSMRASRKLRTSSVSSQAFGVSSPAELMGIEGRVRQKYYQAFKDIIKGDYEFEKRVRRPPDNILNALISFGNSLVYAAVLGQIYRTQLNPTLSFLHEPGARRFSLSLDLAEIFKPLLTDRIVFKLLNTRMLN